MLLRILLACCLCSLVAIRLPAQAPPQNPALQTDEAVTDLYTVPDGNAAELLEYIDRVRTFQPENELEYFTHRRRGPEAIKAAAEKIVAIEKDKTSEAYMTARGLLLLDLAESLPRLSDEEQSARYQEIMAYIASRKEFDVQAMGIAMATAQALERSTNKKLAIKAYETFSELASQSKDPVVSNFAGHLKGAARRVGLVGKPFTFRSVKLDGKKFDLKQWKGKVVLVDFWATWCGPCLDAMPGLKQLYSKYHDRGFEIVGICLDDEREAMEQFVADEELPWTIVHQMNDDGQHPLAQEYGVASIPQMFLVGRDGKVITNDAYGELLEELLADLFQDSKREKTGAATNPPLD